MILDVSKIAMNDGAERQAIELLPGADLCCAAAKTHTKLVSRRLNDSLDVVCIVLSNGRKFCGSTDHRVGVITKAGSIGWRPLSDIMPGDRLRGICDGVRIIVTVEAVLFYAKHKVRLVDFVTEHHLSYVAEGVACR